MNQNKNYVSQSNSGLEQLSQRPYLPVGNVTINLELIIVDPEERFYTQPIGPVVPLPNPGKDEEKSGAYNPDNLPLMDLIFVDGKIVSANEYAKRNKQPASLDNKKGLEKLV